MPAYKAWNKVQATRSLNKETLDNILNQILIDIANCINDAVLAGKHKCTVALRENYAHNDTAVSTYRIQGEIDKTAVQILKNQGYKARLSANKATRRVHVYIGWKRAKKAFQNEETQTECPVCFERANSENRLPCGHYIHQPCLLQVDSKNPRKRSGSEIITIYLCPVCRQVIN
jgi:hypothetical protein